MNTPSGNESILTELMRAVSEMNRGQWERGRVILEEVRRRSPDVVHLYLMLTQYHIHRLDEEEARSAFNRAKDPSCTMQDKDTPDELEMLQSEMNRLHRLLTGLSANVVSDWRSARIAVENETYNEAALRQDKLLKILKGEALEQIRQEKAKCLFLVVNHQLAELLPKLVKSAASAGGAAVEIRTKILELNTMMLECCALDPSEARFKEMSKQLQILGAKHSATSMVGESNLPTFFNSPKLPDFPPQRDNGMISRG